MAGLDSFRESFVDGLSKITLQGISGRTQLYHYTRAESLVSIIQSSEFLDLKRSVHE